LPDLCSSRGAETDPNNNRAWGEGIIVNRTGARADSNDGYSAFRKRSRITKMYLVAETARWFAALIRLEPGSTKNKEGRMIPLASDVLGILRMQRELHDRYHPRKPWVFFRHATGDQLRDFRGGWAAACKKCGLWDEAKERPTRLLHDSRRTGVRNLIRAGVPERVAMTIGGWKSRSVMDRYNIVSESDLHTAAHRLDGYLEESRRKRAEETERQKEPQAARPN